MSARILVVEDNAANLALMTYLLRSFGHLPLLAETGEEGLAAMAAEAPDLVICDIQLPGIDGYAVAERIKAEPAWRSVPLVAVTALAMVGDRDNVLAAGFDGYIAKPIEPETFVQQVEAFLPAGQASSRPAPRASSAPAPTVPEPRGTLLAVDDQPTNLRLKRSLFEPNGYRVLIAATMAEALALALRSPPDLIVSDVRMGDGSGFDFIIRVKADPRLKDIPFVFITSTDCDEASRERGLALGAARFLFRPIEPHLLLAEIETCLRERDGG